MKVYTFTVLLAFLATVSATGQLCGLAEQDPDKTCVSIKLPWQENAIYFCEEKENFHYKNFSSNYISCTKDVQRDNLVVSAPWSCPMVSNPNYCKDVPCPAKPFNRTCTSIPPAEGFMGCCGTAFCEENVKSRDNCHTKVLEPSCQNPPPDKTNCIAFIDYHGCCPKFQCEEDAKPGLCPMEKLAKQFGMSLDGKSDEDGDDEDKETGSEESEDKETTDEPSTPNLKPANQFFAPYFKGGSYQSQVIMALYARQALIQTCVGDYNCPGKLKCCSSTINTYSDGETFPKNNKPTYGTCVKPVRS